MTQDFAKKNRSKEAPPASKPAPGRQVSVLGTFLTGFLCGGFITFLGVLWYLKPADGPTQSDSGKPTAEPQAKVEEMQWDFYEIFPKSVVPVVEEYKKSGEKVVVEDVRWVLQAGSFKDPADADERRATLILLGLNVGLQEVKVSGTRWHRVIVGPFESKLALNRAQDTLAQAEISSIPMKVPAS